MTLGFGAASIALRRAIVSGCTYGLYDGCAPMSFETAGPLGLALSALALPGLVVGGTNTVVDVIGTSGVPCVDDAAVALIVEGVVVALGVDVAAVADVGTSTAPAFASANR